MRGTSGDLTEALDFIDALNRHSSAGDAVAATGAAVARHGFEGVVFLFLPSRGQRFQDVVLGKHLPEEWSRTYVERDYIRDDPLVRYQRAAAAPFAWSEVRIDSERFPRAAEVMRVRSEFGFRDGFVVPVPGAGGIYGGVYLGGARPELSGLRKPALHMMGLYAFERAASFRGPNRKARGVLTEREREVLSWVAVGKSAWDIGQILSISTRTVNEYSQRAIRKLGATNRTHAVVLALRDGLISL